MATPIITENPIHPTASIEDNLDDERLCSDINSFSLLEKQEISQSSSSEDSSVYKSSLNSPNGYLNGECRIERAWAHWKKLGEPKLIVAPMVDNSELPFRMLCRKYGAEAAYTPMLHSRIFTETEKYRTQEFTTCKVRGISLIGIFCLGCLMLFYVRLINYIDSFMQFLLLVFLIFIHVEYSGYRNSNTILINTYY